MRSHVDPDATEGSQTASLQVASNSVYGIISGASYEYQRLRYGYCSLDVNLPPAFWGHWPFGITQPEIALGSQKTQKRTMCKFFTEAVGTLR